MVRNRFDRNVEFFGKRGQDQLRKTHVGIVGIGGLGSHVVQQLAFLGVGAVTLIDPDELEESNLNRLIGARYDDLMPGMKKVDIAKRTIHSIDPEIIVTIIPSELRSVEAFQSINKVDYIFGCVDNDAARFLLNQISCAYKIPYIDIGSEILKTGEFGGQLFINIDGNGCLFCQNILDPRAVEIGFMTPEEKRDRNDIYGIPTEELAVTGPSVVSIDGIIASFAVTEFMVIVTGIREIKRYLLFHGHLCIIREGLVHYNKECPYCVGLWGKAEDAGLERYFNFKNKGE